ncbi:MAG: AI-2E family transporter [Patescibacteria group bacterium]|jgi:predicted PurR-regulated permease PerM
MTELKKVEISHRTIIFTVFFLIFLGLLYFIRVIILQFFVALLIMTVLNPLVTRLSKFKIPRAISILVVYILMLTVIGAALAGVIPPLIDQTTTFVNRLPEYIENSRIPKMITDQLVNEFFSALGSLPTQFAKATVSVFSNLLDVLLVLMFAFYLLMSREKQDKQLDMFLGKSRSKKASKIIDTLEVKLGGWARGELALMMLVGFATYVGLRLLGIPFALPLSILAGLLEIIPYMGPVIAAVPAVIIGFSISPLIGLATTALAFLIQQFENYLFVPKVMEKSVGVSPIIVLLSLTIGFEVAGVVGALIAVPVVIASQILMKEFVISR